MVGKLVRVGKYFSWTCTHVWHFTHLLPRHRVLFRHFTALGVGKILGRVVFSDKFNEDIGRKNMKHNCEGIHVIRTIQM